eukprot:8613340-Pyramimonas_sp.AAC.2
MVHCCIRKGLLPKSLVKPEGCCIPLDLLPAFASHGLSSMCCRNESCPGELTGGGEYASSSCSRKAQLASEVALVTYEDVPYGHRARARGSAKTHKHRLEGV